MCCPARNRIGYEQLKQRSKVDQTLCDNLGVAPFSIPSSCIPTESQLAELDKHIQDLEIEQVSVCNQGSQLVPVSV